jgi:hypothetical protein
MSLLRDLIVPVVVSAAVAAVLTPVLFFVLKRRDERQKRHFEVRYTEYKKYLQAIEEIAAAARIDLKQSYTAVVASTLKDMLADPEQSSDYGPRLDKGLNDLGNEVRATFAKATNGLHGLRLVCSDKLLPMVNEFVELQRELTEESIALIADARISNPSASVSDAMAEKAERAESLFDQILEQMRAELGVPGWGQDGSGAAQEIRALLRERQHRRVDVARGHRGHH